MKTLTPTQIAQIQETLAHARAGKATLAQLAAAHELADQLRQAIGRLPQQQAAAFCMRYFDDQPYEQIAENLGVAVGAVASALHKARGKLKSMLAVSIKED